MTELKREGAESRSLDLRVGDWVEVKSAEEILATLDEGQSVDGLPFMPEMLKYCGQRFRVFKSAHKTADVIEGFSIRRMSHAVHLDLRCEGEFHGGCQAGCLLFWKESWLKRADGDQPARANEGLATDSFIPLDTLRRGTRVPDTEGQPERYRCQGTEMAAATTPVLRRERFDPRFYIRDLTSGNVTLFDFIRFGALAMMNAFMLRWFGRWYPSVVGLAGEKTPTLELNLQPGELVRVRPKKDILKTLNRNSQNRGMNFDCEMSLYCQNGTYRVLRRVDHLIIERTGQMVTLKNPCIILEGVTCSGNRLYQRMFSPRQDYMYFREIWLERVSAAGHVPAVNAAASAMRAAS